MNIPLSPSSLAIQQNSSQLHQKLRYEHKNFTVSSEIKFLCICNIQSCKTNLYWWRYDEQHDMPSCCCVVAVVTTSYRSLGTVFGTKGSDMICTCTGSRFVPHTGTTSCHAACTSYLLQLCHLACPETLTCLLFPSSNSVVVENNYNFRSRLSKATIQPPPIAIDRSWL